MRRLYRSRRNRMIAGDAGGLAEYFNIDPAIVRLLWVIALLPGGIPGLLPYVIFWIVVPEEPAGAGNALGAEQSRPLMATLRVARDEPVATRLPLADPDPAATRTPLATGEPTATPYDAGSARGGDVPGMQPRTTGSLPDVVPPQLEADASAVGSTQAGTTQPSSTPAAQDPDNSTSPADTRRTTQETRRGE